jgi:hypothetical protein
MSTNIAANGSLFDTLKGIPKVDISGNLQAAISAGRRMSADSDEVAWAFRDDVARAYEMMSPGRGASLA